MAEVLAESYNAYELVHGDPRAMSRQIRKAVSELVRAGHVRVVTCVVGKDRPDRTAYVLTDEGRGYFLFPLPVSRHG